MRNTFKKEWINRYFELSKHIAEWSKDPSTKVGAIIVDKYGKILSLGYNGFPRGVEDTEERLNNREVKYNLIVHAEANSILNAATSVSGSRIFTSKFPCNECSKLIVQAGISILYTTSPDSDIELYNRYKEKFEYSKLILKEGNVEVNYI